MGRNQTIPDNPLEFIKGCVAKKKIFWTYHVNMRMKERFIPRNYIFESVENFEIIEEYPKDKYLPSYLVYSRFERYLFHILFAVDLEGENARVVTAYFPSLEEWQPDLKTRR